MVLSSTTGDVFFSRRVETVFSQYGKEKTLLQHAEANKGDLRLSIRPTHPPHVSGKMTCVVFTRAPIQPTTLAPAR